MENITIGNYDIIPDNLPAEGDVMIRIKPIDLVAYWKRCGILADFTAAFYAFTQKEPKVQENTISTIFNELIENATKYSVKRNAEVTVHMKLYDTVLKIQIDNITTENHYKHFKQHLDKLLSSDDLDSLYFDTLASKSEGSPDSGIGLLILLKDYPIKFGARFNHNTETDTYRVSIQAFYYLEQ